MQMRPLTGLRLAEATGAGAPVGVQLAAALCGRLAADLGATVLRLERENDALRALPPRLGPTSATHAFLNAGKTLLRCRDMDEAGFLADLLGNTDAAILDVELHTQHAATAPRVRAVLAMADDATLRYSEFTVEALSGLLDIVGDPAREPLRLAGHQVAYAAGLAAFTGLTAALARPGEERVRVDLLEVAIWLNWKSVATAFGSGQAPSRKGPGAEWLVVPCADGHVALVYQEKNWPALLEAGQDDRLAEDRFQTPAGRRQHRLALNAILAEAFLDRTRDQVRQIAIAKRLPIGAVWSPAELASDQQMIARRFFQTAVVDGVEVVVPRLPALWNGEALGPAATTEEVR